MKHTIKVGMLVSVLLLSVAGNPVPILAVGEDETQKHLVIIEVSPEAADGAAKEFVHLYNPNNIDIEVSGWMLQYRSASYKADDAKGWSTRAILGCQSIKQADCPEPQEVIARAGETLQLSSYKIGDSVLPMASGMATTGGVVRLVQSGQDQDLVIHDKVGYGAALDYEGASAAPAPKAGQEIVRLQDNEDHYIDTDHNGADFMLIAREGEQAGPVATVPTDEQPDHGTGPIVAYAEIEVSELLPDPVSPQTDSDDEFVELYNPHSEVVDLNGYVIVTGANWTHKYTIKDVQLAPYGYVSLTSAQTSVSLSNTGTGLRLYDPAGKLLFEVPSYGKARPGNSWVRDTMGTWVWTAKPSPDTQNVVELPATAVKPPGSTAKKPAAKATNSKKASTPKVSAVKGVSTPAAQPAQTQVAGGNQAGMWVLGVAAVLGVGYALFEYRQDIGGFVRRRWEALTSMGRK